MAITVRLAQRDELAQVNELRRMVNEVHVQGRPDIFRPGFCEELQQHIYTMFDAENSDVVVALMEGEICGFATVEYIHRPESPYNLARSFYHVQEFGVSEKHRRQGVATALVDFMRQEAKRLGLPRLELDMWQFNEGAQQFYEAVGFRTYRRYMELDV